MFEAITSKLDMLKPFKVVPAFAEAFKKAKEAKDKGFFERVSLFFEAFKSEMEGVKEERAGAGAEAEKVAAKPLEEVMAEAKKALAFEEGAKVAGDEDTKNAEVVLGSAVASFKELPAAEQAAAKVGVDALEDPKELNPEAAKALGKASLSTLLKLKKKSGSEEAFLKLLESFEKVGGKSKYSVEKLLKLSTLKVFKIGGSEALDLADKFGIGITDTLSVMKLKKLKEGPLDDAGKAEVSKVMAEFFLPNSSSEGVSKVVEIINKVLVEKPESLDKKDLAALVFNIADADLEKLISKLS